MTKKQVFLFGTSLVFIALLSPISLHAKPLTIKGNFIDYQHQNNSIVASENVELSRGSHTVTSNLIHYNIKNQQITFPETFSIFRKEYSFSADRFNYNFDKNHGHADQIRGKVQRLNIRGDDTEFSIKNISIKNARFTTCDRLDHPHYVFESNHLIIYPQFGFFVAFDNWFNASILPFPIWVPSYVYGSEKYSVLGVPLPIIGSNDREGLYIKHSIGYFLNKHANGSIDIGTSEKLGLYLGFNHNQIINANNLINTKLHRTSEEGFEGGITWYSDFGKESQDPDDSLLPFLSTLSSKRKGQFILQSTYKEIINDSRVDKAPVLTINFAPLDLAHKTDLTTQLSAGRIKENDETGKITQDHFYGLATTLENTKDLHPHFSLNSRLIYDGKRYRNNPAWEIGYADFTLDWDWSLLNPEFTYRNLLLSQNQSPFTYQNESQIESDEIGIFLSSRLGNIEPQFRGDYNINTQAARRLEYALVYHMHCWNLVLAWDAAQERMRFGFNII